jgi:hypothetical protein
MNDSTSESLNRFLQAGQAAQLDVDLAIARADVVSLVKVAHDELVAAQARLVAARGRFKKTQRLLTDFDRRIVRGAESAPAGRAAK